MARMIPDIAPDAIENVAERTVFIALKKQLPSTWVVRHQFPFYWKNGQYLRDGEVDFIVLAPNIGVLFLEIKGSRGYECRNGEWFRLEQDGSLVKTKDPFRQVTHSAHQVVA